MNHIAPQLRTLLIVIAAVVAAGFAVTPASAQFGGRANFGAAFQPDIMQRDVTLMTSSLALEEWQRPIVEALLQDYMSSFNTGVEALKDRMKVASEDAVRINSTNMSANGDAVLERIMAPLNAWRTEKQQMLEKFMSDLKSQLGPQQLERWSAFERALRRERMLPDGDISGESIDLLAVLTRMQLTPAEQEAVKQPVAAYEVLLDDALVSRVTEITKLEPELSDAMRAMNFERGADVQDKIMVARVAVRSANDLGIELIAAALGDRGDEFHVRALEAGYPDVFRPHPVMILMQQAYALPSLTPDQTAQIDALMTEFSVACNDANMKIYEAVRTDQPKAPRKRVQTMADRKSGAAGSAPNTPQGANSSDPVVKARVDRESMGAPFRDRLLAILTDAQRSELPGGVKVDTNESRKDEGPKKGAKPDRTPKLSSSEEVETKSPDTGLSNAKTRPVKGMSPAGPATKPE
ncbi:MAG: hypothetical protein DWH86_01255 [Planctomycetota bacterium]|nr:MAG: hypothetical protein DWH86_01255 [Planctomycetota bacterium]